MQNPIFTKEIAGSGATYQGTYMKALLLVATVAVSAITAPLILPPVMAYVSLAIAFGLGLYICSNPEKAILSIPYAVLEGLSIGMISYSLEAKYPGIVVTSVLLTLGTVMVCSALYNFNIIRVSDKFIKMVVISTTMLAVYYICGSILSLIGIQTLATIEEGITGIVISLIAIVIVSARLLVDFEFIKRTIENGAESYYEWYFGFGICITVIWLYLEIIDLLAKLKKKN